MDQTVPWYKSKGIWTGIVVTILGIYTTVQTNFPNVHIPAIPEWLFALLGAMGIYTRAVATNRVTPTDETK